jgi:hypothetical protein
MKSDDELRRIAESFKLTTNQIGIEDFDGYSPDEMDAMLYDPFSPDCPVQLNKVDDEVLRQIPLYNLARHLLEMLSIEKIKVEDSGFLPAEVVKFLYDQGYYQDYEIESGELYFTDPVASYSIVMAQVLLHLMEAIKEENGYVEITPKGNVLLQNPNRLLKEMILNFGQGYDWSLMDESDDAKIGKIGWSFSLALVQKFCKEPIMPAEIVFMYFRAFPALLKGHDIEDAYYIYVFRTMTDFMHLLGLTRIWQDDLMELPKKVQATPLLYKLISVRAPKHYQHKERN